MICLADVEDDEVPVYILWGSTYLHIFIHYLLETKIKFLSNCAQIPGIKAHLSGMCP